jgi:RES domain-containing protein
VVVWRLSRTIHQDLSGLGGYKYTGRWNEVGLPVVYTSASLALSVLERRVHSIQQPKDDVSIEIEIPDASVEIVASLPNNWKQNLALTRAIGSQWLRSNRSLCLRVPSAIVADFNYLINPQHPDMNLVKIIAVVPFQYDPRLFE